MNNLEQIKLMVERVPLSLFILNTNFKDFECKVDILLAKHVPFSDLSKKKYEEEILSLLFHNFISAAYTLKENCNSIKDKLIKEGLGLDIDWSIEFDKLVDSQINSVINNFRRYGQHYSIPVFYIEYVLEGESDGTIHEHKGSVFLNRVDIDMFDDWSPKSIDYFNTMADNKIAIIKLAADYTESINHYTDWFCSVVNDLCS